MEDKLVICGDFLATSRLPQNADYFAVFDGHNGDECAVYCANDLHGTLSKHLEATLPAATSASSSSASTRNVTANTIMQSFKAAFTECNQALEKSKKTGGTTAVVALFLEKDLWVANSGDSRAVLCRHKKAHRVTVDHKPHLPQERERIVRSGGVVMNGKITGSLTVSRALGDNSYKPHVTCEPDVFGPFNFTDPDCQFLILACDGLWDVVDDEEAVQIALDSNDPHDAAVKLREKAKEKLSRDNISVLVVFCPHFKPAKNSDGHVGSARLKGSNTTNSSKLMVTSATFSITGKPSTSSSPTKSTTTTTTATTSPIKHVPKHNKATSFTQQKPSNQHRKEPELEEDKSSSDDVVESPSSEDGENESEEEDEEEDDDEVDDDDEEVDDADNKKD